MTAVKEARRVRRVLSDSPRAVSARNRRWKMRAAEILHQAADEAGHCSEYDKVVVRAGLPPRPKNRRHYPDFQLVAESTEEEFLAWKRRAERFLLVGARHSEVDLDNALRVLGEAGFDVSPLKSQNVTVEVTVRFEMSVQSAANSTPEDLRDALDESNVYTRAYDLAQNQPETRSWRVVTDG